MRRNRDVEAGLWPTMECRFGKNCHPALAECPTRHVKRNKKRLPTGTLVLWWVAERGFWRKV